jgi:hypothetical protein
MRYGRGCVSCVPLKDSHDFRYRYPIAAASRPILLINTVVADEDLQQIAQRLPSLELVYVPEPAAAEAALQQHAARVQVVLTIGSVGLSAADGPTACFATGLRAGCRLRESGRGPCSHAWHCHRQRCGHQRQLRGRSHPGLGAGQRAPAGLLRCTAACRCVAHHAAAARRHHRQAPGRAGSGHHRPQDRAACPGVRDGGGLPQPLAQGRCTVDLLRQLLALAEWADVLVVATPGGAGPCTWWMPP